MNKQSKEYKQYMKSDEWEQKRQERIAIDQGCVMCGRPIEKIKSVQVHHVTYKNLGNEDGARQIYALCAALVTERYIISIIARGRKG